MAQKQDLDTEAEPDDRHPLYAWRKSRPPGFQSLAAAEERLGISASLICRYERRTRFPSAKLAIKLEALTGIDRRIFRPDIFGEPDDKSAA